ncbi:hypothetical protein GBA52_004296 [Prunus armeniaca]|nr:hypothetical protein GBA52_004296 [Prunus armeniaca]
MDNIYESKENKSFLETRRVKSGVSMALGDDETAAANERQGEVLAERTPLDFSKRKLPYTV